MSQMRDEQLKHLIDAHLKSSIGGYNSDIDAKRKKALNFYDGQKFGDEQPGESEIVSTDVYDVVESILPDAMEVFAGTENPIEVVGEGPEDEEAAKQASAYINAVWNDDNHGFAVTYDLCKDALLQGNGIVKVIWDKSEDVSKETFDNLSTEAVLGLEQERGVKIVAFESREAQPDEGEFFPDGYAHTVTVERRIIGGRARIFNVPPEEFRISARSKDEDEAHFVCHETTKTRSDLVDMGFSRAKIDKLPRGTRGFLSTTRIARYRNEQWKEDLTSAVHKALDPLDVRENYIRADRNDDGIAELLFVMTAGEGHEILEIEEVPEHGFVSMVPIRQSHCWLGKSVAETVFDIQLIKSTVLRQLLRNMYNINNGRFAINEQVNIDDFLVNRPDAIVRVEGQGSPANSIYAIQSVSLGPYAFPVLEHMDGIRELRTGVTRYSQGLDADALNKTASGMNMILGRSDRRVKLIFRLFAELGFKRVGGKLMRLFIRHQDRPRLIRLRNQWVNIDPSRWSEKWDVRVNTGLGYGSKELAARQKFEMLAVQKEIIQAQGGFGGNVTPASFTHTLHAWVNDMGLRNAEQFFPDSANKPPPPPKPDPKVQLEAARLEMDKQRMGAELQMQDRTNKADMAMKQADMAMKERQAANDIQLANKKADNEIRIAQMKANVDLQIVNAKAKTEMEMNAARTQAETQTAAVKTQADIQNERVKTAAVARATAAKGGPKKKESRK